MPIPTERINYVFELAFDPSGQSNLVIMSNQVTNAITINDLVSPAPLTTLPINSSQVSYVTDSDGVEFSLNVIIPTPLVGVASWAIANFNSNVNKVFFYDNYNNTYNLDANTTITITGKSYY